MDRAVTATGATTAVRPRLGFLGAGWIGRQRLAALDESGLAEIVAVADPALRAGELGADELSSLGELLERDLDGIVIATPSALHAEQAIACLEHGLAVFCQKPVACTAAEARRVVEAARAADRLLAVDLCYRFVDGARRVREVVLGGELGRVHTADLQFHNAYGPDRGWYYDRRLSGGGCVVDLGTHLVDLALWTLGWPTVGAVSSRLHASPEPSEVESFALAQLDLEDEATVRLACSWGAHAGRDCVFEATFWGTHGGASLQNVGGSFYDFRALRFTGTSATTIAEPPQDWAGLAALDWARRLARGERFTPESERFVAVADVVDRIYGRPS
jgi:predicted dehydrogenase